MPDTTLTVLPDEPLGTISPFLHGHFIEHLGRCCNDGMWVGPNSPIPNHGGLRADVLAALKTIGLPLLRWPGGCFADSYHWRDGIGVPENRPRVLGESCGLNALEDNGLGTHEFIRFCREVGAEPYLAGNVGSGSPQEMCDWVQYCNGTHDSTLARERAANGHPDPMNVRLWGVGNENWGCGGNYEAADYAKEYRRFATFLKMTDRRIELVACGDWNPDWNLGVVETLSKNLDLLDHLSVHRYWHSGPAIGMNEAEHYRLMRGGDLLEHDIRRTDELLRFFTGGRKKITIAFDEWGVWHPEAVPGTNYEAPNTLRDAVAAAGALDAFHRWSDRMSTANLAQTVNVLQCLVQTEGDRMWVTPTGRIFQMYTPHQGGTALRVDVECPTVDAGAQESLKAGPLSLLSASASRKAGKLNVSVSNRHPTRALEVTVKVRGGGLSEGTLHTLEGGADAVNGPDQPNAVQIADAAFTVSGDTLTLTLPPCSVHTAVLGLV